MILYQLAKQMEPHTPGKTEYRHIAGETEDWMPLSEQQAEEWITALQQSGLIRSPMNQFGENAL